MRRGCMILILMLTLFSAFGQIDSSFISKLKAIDQYNNLKADTAELLDDALTRKIQQLRSEKGGVSIETILQIKMAEEVKDTSLSSAYYKDLKAEVTSGRTAHLISNCVINLYRRYYTESEIDEMIRFYRTSAGKKSSSEQLLLMLQSVKDSELILKKVSEEMKKNYQKKNQN